MSSPPGGKPETRQAILEAARRLFERESYHDVGLEEVAREAGVSRQAVYLHFGSKARVFMGALQLVNEANRMGDRLGRIADACSGVVAMERWVELNAITVPRILPFVVRMDGARRSDPEVEAAWQTQARDRRRWCRRIVRRMSGEGTLSPQWTVAAAADYMWVLTMPRVVEDLLERGWSAAKYERYTIALLRSALVV